MRKEKYFGLIIEKDEEYLSDSVDLSPGQKLLLGNEAVKKVTKAYCPN